MTCELTYIFLYTEGRKAAGRWRQRGGGRRGREARAEGQTHGGRTSYSKEGRQGIGKKETKNQTKKQNKILRKKGVIERVQLRRETERQKQRRSKRRIIYEEPAALETDSVMCSGHFLYCWFWSLKLKSNVFHPPFPSLNSFVTEIYMTPPKGYYSDALQILLCIRRRMIS